MNHRDDIIEITDLEEKHIPQLLDLVNREFAIRKDYEYIIWQCRENPNPVVIKVALSGDAVVGWFGIQKRQLSTGLACGQISYIYIRPEWRGKGLLKKMGHSALTDMGNLDIACIFANSSALIPFQSHFNMKVIQSIPYYHQYTATQGEKQYSAQKTTISKKIAAIPWHFGDRISFIHDPSFNHWRFVQNVQYEYFLLTLTPAVYAVVKIFHDPGREKNNGDIVQFFCNYSDEHEVINLFSSVSDFFSRQGIQEIITWIPEHPVLMPVLKRLGYTKGKVATNFLMRAPDRMYQSLGDYSRWVVMPSDATNY